MLVVVEFEIRDIDLGIGNTASFIKSYKLYFDCDVADCSPSLELLKFICKDNEELSSCLSCLKSIPKLSYGCCNEPIFIQTKTPEDTIFTITIKELPQISVIQMYRKMKNS